MLCTAGKGAGKGAWSIIVTFVGKTFVLKDLTRNPHTHPKITCYTVVLLLRRTLIVFIVRAIGITIHIYRGTWGVTVLYNHITITYNYTNNTGLV